MTTNLLALAQHKIYLQSRIALLVQKHADYKAKEHETPESDHKLALNSSAACIWDAKCEIESALENIAHTEAKLYPFSIKRLYFYKGYKPEMTFLPDGGGEIAITATDIPEEGLNGALDYLLTTARKMSVAMHGEGRNEDLYEWMEEWAKLQPEFQMPKLKVNYHDQQDKSDVFTLLANATKIGTTPEETKDIDEAEYKSDYPFRFSMGIKPHTAKESIAFFQEMMNTPTDVSKAIVEPANTANDIFSTGKPIGYGSLPIVEPEDSNSIIGHED